MGGFVAYGLNSDTEKSSRWALVGVRLESSTHRLERFRYGRMFLNHKAHLSRMGEVTL